MKVTKFKTTFKKSAAVLAAAALTVSGLAGTGSFGGVLRNETELVSAAYESNSYETNYGIYIGENWFLEGDDEGKYGVWKAGSDNKELSKEPFSADGFSWDNDSKTLTLTNFNFKCGVDVIALNIPAGSTIKLFGDNKFEFAEDFTVKNALINCNSKNLTIEGPGSLTLVGKDNNRSKSLYCDSLTVNNCSLTITGGIQVDQNNPVINNSDVSVDGNSDSIPSATVNGSNVELTADETGRKTISGCIIESNGLGIDQVMGGTASNLMINVLSVNGYEITGVSNLTSGTDGMLESGYAASNASASYVDGECIGTAAKNAIDPLSIIVRESSGTEYKTINYLSIADYLTNIVMTSNDSKEIEMATAWLNYASAAQTYFGYQTDKLANRYLKADDAKVTGKADVIRALRSNPEVSGITAYSNKYPEQYIGTSLTLGDSRYNNRIAVKHYFTEAVEGLNLTETIVGGNTYYTTTAYLNSVKGFADKGNYYYRPQESPESSIYDYVYSTLRSSENTNLINLCCALYDLGTAAEKM